MGVLRTLQGIGLAGALALTACTAPDPPEGNFETQDVAVSEDSGGGSDVTLDGGEALETMDGTWLHYDQVATCVNFAGADFEQLTNYLHIVRITEDDNGDLTEEWQACNCQLSEVFGLQPAVVPTLYATHFPFTTDTGHVTSTDIEGVYTSGPIAVLWGMTMDDRVNDPFPTETDDPRIQDVDMDGDPAFSLSFNNGDCISYLAQRAVNEYEGEFVSADRVMGGVIGTNEQIIVGGTGSLCQVSYDTTFPPQRNRFERVRIDGQGGALDFDTDGNGTITCEEVTDLVTFRPTAIEYEGSTLIPINQFNHNCCRPADRPDFPTCPVDMDR